MLERFEADRAFERRRKDASDMSMVLEFQEKTRRLSPSRKLDVLNAFAASEGSEMSDAARYERGCDGPADCYA